MNIYFLASWFPSRVHPTHGNFVARHARLVARRHAVTVVTIQDDPALGVGTTEFVEAEADGYRVVQVYFGQGGLPGPARVALRFRAWAQGIRRAEALTGRPDVLHGHVLLDGGIVAALWGRRWGVEHIITEHSWAYRLPGALSGIRGWLGRFAVRRSKVVMPVSSALAHGMQELNGLVGNYRVVSNVVDAKVFSYRPPPPGPLRLLHVSNFVGEKNLPGLLRAFGSLEQDPARPVTLHLAGDGDMKALQRAVNAMGHRGVTTSGPHTETEVAELMARHHALVLASFYETQGVVLLEAQMCGRPCVATAVGGVVDVVIPGETGWLVPVNDTSALTAAMLQLRDTYGTFDLPAIRQRALGMYSEEAVLMALEEEYGVVG